MYLSGGDTSISKSVECDGKEVDGIEDVILKVRVVEDIFPSVAVCQSR